MKNIDPEAKPILIALFLLWSVALLWEGEKGRRSGEVSRKKGVFVNQYSSSSRVKISREESPRQFWLIVGAYYFIGCCALVACLFILLR